MFCNKCGADIAEGANFCAKCGAGITKPETDKPQSTDAETIVQFKVSFGEAFRRLFTKRSFTYKGRISRSDYWWTVLVVGILNAGISSLLPPVAFIAFVINVYAGWRRMQDIGKNGWWSVVPFYNIYLCCQPSQMMENKYGFVPNTSPIQEDVKWRNAAYATCGICIIIAFIF